MFAIDFSEDDVRRSLNPALLITAIELGFRDRFPSLVIPSRTSIQLVNGIFLTMPCYDSGTHVLGTKFVLVREKASPGHDRVQATYLLMDPDTARPRLTVAANYLTDLRTAVTSAVATKFLARTDASTLGIFGTGRLAHTHLAVLPLVRKFTRVLICGRDPARTAHFVEQVVAESHGLTIEAVDARTCAAESDVLCTCTSHPLPLFDGRDLRAGTHLNLVGAFRPDTREVDTETIRRSRLVVDTYEAARAEAGELLIPLREGFVTDDHVASDLHSLLSGKKQGRSSAEELTVFKSVGCALEDLVAAEVLLAASR